MLRNIALSPRLGLGTLESSSVQLSRRGGGGGAVRAIGSTTVRQQREQRGGGGKADAASSGHERAPREVSESLCRFLSGKDRDACMYCTNYRRRVFDVLYCSENVYVYYMGRAFWYLLLMYLLSAFYHDFIYLYIYLNFTDGSTSHNILCDRGAAVCAQQCRIIDSDHHDHDFFGGRLHRRRDWKSRFGVLYDTGMYVGTTSKYCPRGLLSLWCYITPTYQYGRLSRP